MVPTRQRATAAAITFAALAGCGGGGGGAATVTIGGSVTGLAGSGLVLRDNGADSLAVSTAGTFVFSTLIAANTQYAVTVAAQPTNPTQDCVVSRGSGRAASAAVTTVAIQCTTSQFTLGGTVSGLSGQGLLLSDGGGDDLNISADGSFAFAKTVASGSAYSVVVTTQPGNPLQNCAVTGGIGKVTNAAVTNVSVSCKGIGRFAYVLTDSDPTLGTNYGIWASTIDPVTGAFNMTTSSPYAAGAFPLDVAATPNTQFVYATSLDSGGQGIIYAYAIDPTTGALAAVPGMPFAASSLATAASSSGQPSSGIIAVDPQNRFLYVLASSSILAYAISAADGSLAPVSGSPFSSGARLDSIVVDPSGRFVYVADTGADEIWAYVIDAATGALAAAPGGPAPAGSTPKTIAIDSTGGFVYVEILPNDISAYRINSSTGALSAVGGSPFAASPSYEGPGPMAADPNSGFLFQEGTGLADVSVVGIDSTTGALTMLNTQSGIDLSPGGFGAEMNIDPSGKFAYILNSNDPAGSNIAGFAIDSTTGNFTRLANLVWETDPPYSIASFAVAH